MAEIYKDGPFKGMASVECLIGPNEFSWLQHASTQTGQPIDELVRIAAEETALEWAKANGLLKPQTKPH